MKFLKHFFNRKIVAIDIKKYNELKQQFDDFKVETNRNFTKWFEKMPIGYAVHDKNASSDNKTAITKGKGVISFAWAMHQPNSPLNNYLSNIYSHLAYDIAKESILFDVYKQNLQNLETDGNLNLIAKAVIDNCEYKFFYNIVEFEEFAKKQYNTTYDEVDKRLTDTKKMEYKVNRDF
jgi:hypothetical protein